MTQEQAAQLIAQQEKLLQVYKDVLPFIQTAVHDIFPLLAVMLCLGLGVVFGMAATA